MSEGALEAWLRHRTIPKNRADSDSNAIHAITGINNGWPQWKKWWQDGQRKFWTRTFLCRLVILWTRYDIAAERLRLGLGCHFKGKEYAGYLACNLDENGHSSASAGSWFRLWLLARFSIPFVSSCFMTILTLPMALRKKSVSSSRSRHPGMMSDKERKAWIS